MAEPSETIIEWTRQRRLHVVAPKDLVQPAEVAALGQFARDHDDLDKIADALALLVGHPVRVRAWTPPTADFYLEVATSADG